MPHFTESGMPRFPAIISRSTTCANAQAKPTKVCRCRSVQADEADTPYDLDRALGRRLYYTGTAGPFFFFFFFVVFFFVSRCHYSLPLLPSPLLFAGRAINFFCFSFTYLSPRVVGSGIFSYAPELGHGADLFPRLTSSFVGPLSICGAGCCKTPYQDRGRN